MLNLANVFEKIIDAFDDGTLAQENFVSHGHELVLHVFPELGDKLNAIIPKFGKQRRGEIAPVGENLAEHIACELADDSPVPVVHIAGRNAESNDFTFVIDCEVQFEAVKPAC